MKRIWTFFRISVIIGAVIFAVTSMKTEVVQAAGCPPAQSVGCGCQFVDGVGVTDPYTGVTHWTCNYLCGSCNPGEEHMVIERTIEFYQ
jgi:hypothetical protein